MCKFLVNELVDFYSGIPNSHKSNAIILYPPFTIFYQWPKYEHQRRLIHNSLNLSYYTIYSAERQNESPNTIPPD